MVSYRNDGFYELVPNKINCTVERDLVWSDAYVEHRERWLIAPRAPGVNEYTYVSLRLLSSSICITVVYNIFQHNR